jgi:hypothetical protein
MAKNTDNPAPHAGEKETVNVHDEDTAAKDAGSDASKPQGTLRDQVTNMESEGQAQPQSGELPPEERPVVERPSSDRDEATEGEGR